MLKFFAATILMLAATPVLADDASDQRESKVYQMLADMEANRQKLKERYACVLRGECITEPNANRKATITPVIMVRCESTKKNYSFAAKSHTIAEIGFNNKGLPIDESRQVWKMELRNKKHVRYFSVNRRFETLTTLEYIKVRRKVNGTLHIFDPIDDVLDPFQITSSTPTNRQVEQFLNHYKLIETKDGLAGRFSSKWKYSHAGYGMEIELTHSSAHGNMPIEYNLETLSGPMTKHFVNAKFEWRELDDLWLPTKVSFAFPLFFGSQEVVQQNNFQVDYKLGKEVPENCFEFESDEPREEVLALFNIDFDRYIDGQVVRATTPWKVPENLYGEKK
ncbi:MAG: hypothetical protein WBD31_04175 [Rubripirellula sp.]